MTQEARTPTTTPEQKPSPVLVVLLIIPLVGILVALLMIATDPNTRAASTLPGDLNPQSASLINFKAPAFDVLDPNGEMFSLLDYEGRVIFLNFWQTTCEPCKKEMPDFQRFAREQGDDGVAVITINFGESTETVRQWLAANDIVGLTVGLDYESRIQRAYGVANIPTTFVIDEQGIVTYMKLGAMTLDEMYEYADTMIRRAG